MNLRKFIFLILLAVLLIPLTLIAQDKKIKISDDLEILEISENAYIYISYYDLESTPHYPTNGMIYINGGSCFLIDTPWTIRETEALINWINSELQVRVEGVIITHWHSDSMGGLEFIKKNGIKSYANNVTLETAKAKDLPEPETGFNASLILNLGNKELHCWFLGGGHTIDNIVVWMPGEKILFAGCFAKAMNWQGLGYLGDADLKAWPIALNRALKEFPDSKIVIPGHGSHGNTDILLHTLELLAKIK